jgi:hypothetical protein
VIIYLFYILADGSSAWSTKECAYVITRQGWAAGWALLFPRLSPFRFQRAGSHPVGDVENYGTTVVDELEAENANAGHACNQRGDTPIYHEGRATALQRRFLFDGSSYFEGEPCGVDNFQKLDIVQ